MALEDFLNKFNDIKGRNVCVIDPLNTFDLYFSFDRVSKIKYNFEDLCKLNSDDNFSMFVQRLNLPNFSVIGDTTADTIVANVQMHKMLLSPQSQTFTMEIINTKTPVIENIIYPWMREVQSPSWQYDEYPFTKADLTIDLTRHANIKYHMLGIRPTEADTYNPAQETNTNLVRTVTFTFDFMYVDIVGSSHSYGGAKLLTKLVNKGLKSIGL